MTDYSMEPEDVLLEKGWRTNCPGHIWRSWGSFCTVEGEIRHGILFDCKICGMRLFRPMGEEGYS